MFRKLILFSLASLLICILAFILFVFAVSKNSFGHLYSQQELLDFKNEVASVVTSEEGKPLGKIFNENRTNIHFEEIPKHLIDALVATEDARYFKHGGIDSRSLMRVLVKTILLGNKSAGGGSTLNQQLAKNISGRKGSGRFNMLINKTKEGLMAHRLEQVYTKEDILTLYFNTVPFGENIYGIESAALRFFNKEVSELNLQESAVLIGLLKANTYYNPRLHPKNAIRRRNVVLGQMKKYKYLNQLEVDSLKELPLALDYMNLASKGPANYFLVEVKKEAAEIFDEIEKETGKKWDLKKDGLIIQTTLSYDLQKYALKAFHDHLKIMQKRLRDQYKTENEKQNLKNLSSKELKRLNLTALANSQKPQEIFGWDSSYTASITVRDSIEQALTLLHAGLLALHPQTGAIKAYVGGIDFESQPYDQIKAKRQLASTFKPILYAAALEEGYSPCKYLKNEFVPLENYPDWQPKNYDETEGGYYSFNGALIKSMNIPALNLYPQVNYEDLNTLWQHMGFTSQLQNVPSNALGTSEGNLYELAMAYATFANGGYKVYPKAITSIKTQDGETLYQNPLHPTRERILNDKSSQIISAILQNAIKRGTGVSMKNIYGVELPLAGKTGTSQDFTDAWFACFNPELVMITRVGASSNSIHFNSGSNGSGSTLALPLVARTLKSVQEHPKHSTDWIVQFPTLSSETLDLLNCQDFKETIEVEEAINPQRPSRNKIKPKPASKTKPSKKDIRKKKRRIKKNKR